MQVMYDLHEPGAYFDRLEDLYIVGKLQIGRAQARHLRRRPWRWLSTQTTTLLRSLVLFAKLMRGIPDASLRREYRARLWRLVRARPEAYVVLQYVLKCALHYHAFTMARQMMSRRVPVYSSL